MVPDGVEPGTSPRRVSRRGLFRARPNPATPAPPTSTAPLNGTYSLINASRPLMGSYFEVRLGSGVPGAVDLATRALDVVEELEAQLTVYNDESEVSRLNATAHLGPVEVEAGLVRPPGAGRRDRPDDRRGLRRDRRRPLAGLGVHPGAEAGARRRRPWPTPAPGPARIT